MKKLGRPRRQDINLPVLIRAYQETHSIRKSARIIGIPAPTAWNRLKEVGLV